MDATLVGYGYGPRFISDNPIYYVKVIYKLKTIMFLFFWNNKTLMNHNYTSTW